MLFQVAELQADFRLGQGVTDLLHVGNGMLEVLEAKLCRAPKCVRIFHATAVLILIDRGLLRKTDPIATWYPEFPNGDRITVDDLLRMRSGIPAANDDEVLARVYDHPVAPAPSLADELSRLARLKADFKPPDSEGVYTDFNYDILARHRTACHRHSDYR